MEEALQYIDIGMFRSLFTDKEIDARLGNDFFIVDVKVPSGLEEPFRMMEAPCRFDGYAAIFCLEGRFLLDINLDTFEIRPKSLVVSIPGAIIRLHPRQDRPLEDCRFIIVAMSRAYMSSVRLDFNKLFNESMAVLDNPCLTLDGQELDLCRKYLDLAVEVLSSQVINKKEALGSLISLVFYVLGSIWSERISDARSSREASSSRVKLVFDQFLQLVTDYHTSERGMAFYAQKLCLTPKYLSKLVKQASGRSAPDWIDSFVILEAKNMLKYSSRSIKEIVFALHFPNQSVFYKFFKAHTGMTPSEYRNS